MSSLLSSLEQKFGKENVNIIHFSATEQADLKAYPFITVDVQMRSKVKLLMTNNLSAYHMPVLEKFIGKEHNELYFCLPSYWDLDDQTNPNFAWVFEALFKLQKHVQEKNTWFGMGHTIPFANPLKPMSERMKQSYFFLTDPDFMAKELQAMQVEDKTVHFLGIIPIFEDELDYKQGKGTYKFKEKLSNHNITEILDDYRSTVLKTKWRFFGK